MNYGRGIKSKTAKGFCLTARTGTKVIGRKIKFKKDPYAKVRNNIKDML